MNRGVLDIRTYALVPGTGAEFDRLFKKQSIPLLRRFRIHIVAHGVSLDDEDGYLLIRHFASEQKRREQLEAFYGSDAWGEISPHVMPLIDSYHIVVVPTPQEFSLDAEHAPGA